MSDKKEELKKRVIEYVKAQPGYDQKKHEKLMLSVRIKTPTW